MTYKLRPFTAQSWKGQNLTLQIDGLSYDAARHIAMSHAALGETGRIVCEGEDYTEVFQSDGAVRAGTFAETTLVRF